MKFINEFRQPKVAEKLAQKIALTVNSNRYYQLMEFCGGHTHALHRYGLLDLLPNNINMIHGPGCPVCVLPIAKVDQAVFLAKQSDVIFTSYADMLRVPGSKQNSLLKAKAEGADVRMIYSAEDALQIAQSNPDQKVIFFAIGFETTAPATAMVLKQAKSLDLKNFFVFCNHVLTPVAMQAILNSEEVKIDGFVGPSHVSVIIGSEAYQQVATRYHKPIVISGFEPLDVLQSILWLVEMINKAETGVKNQYTRAVTSSGNHQAQGLIQETLALRDRFEWRGLGFIDYSALQINEAYRRFDAEFNFDISVSAGQDHKQCACPQILRGLKKPLDCKLFGKACTPEQPLGACMVSSEGACAAQYQYGNVAV